MNGGEIASWNLFVQTNDSVYELFRFELLHTGLPLIKRYNFTFKHGRRLCCDKEEPRDNLQICIGVYIHGGTSAATRRRGVDPRYFVSLVMYLPL